MIPDDDVEDGDVEDGEILFDDSGEDGLDIYERLQELREWDASAAADYVYDPIRDKGRGFE